MSIFVVRYVQQQGAAVCSGESSYKDEQPAAQEFKRLKKRPGSLAVELIGPAGELLRYWEDTNRLLGVR